MRQKSRTGVAHWKIRRAGIRGVRICERHGDKDAVIAPFATTLRPLLQVYWGLLVVVRDLIVDSGQRQGSAKAFTAALHACMVRWTGLLVLQSSEQAAVGAPFARVGSAPVERMHAPAYRRTWGGSSQPSARARAGSSSTSRVRRAIWPA